MKFTNWNQALKRSLSALLTLAMLCGMLPVNARGSENTEANPWSGRSAVFVGDSITAGVGTTKIYYRYLEQTLGFGSVTAMGVGGSCISAASDYGESNQPLINRYQNIPTADLIVIFMGTNDYGHETPLGSASDTQDGTFYGALNTIIPALVEKHPSSKIVFVTSLHRYGFGTSKILGTKFTYDYLPNGVGAALGDYVNAVKAVCAENGVSVIDLHTQCTLDPSDAAVRDAYMPDGIHPNAAGHEVIAKIMESHILGYEPVETEPVELPEMIQGNKFAAGNNQPCRASSRVNYYLKAGTVITLKNPDVMQWACAKTGDEHSSNNLGYFPEKQWTDMETAVVEEDGWVGFTFKYRDESQAFDLTKPLSDYITITQPHTHTYTPAVTVPTCTEAGFTTYTCECGDSYRTPWLDQTAYEGKTIACVGDSITCGIGVTKDETDYVTFLAKSLGMEYIRLGVSGTTLCAGGSRTCNISRLTEAYLEGADIVTIALGINDFCAAGAGYYELGDIHSTDSSTIYGAARMWCERIAELRKTDSLQDTVFYFLTPVICSWNNSVTSARDWDQSKKNIHGYTLRDLCNAIIEVAALYDVEVIDLNLLSGMYYVDAQDNNTAVFGGDGVHPGETGHRMMAAALENALLQNDLKNDHEHIYGSWITTTYPDCEAGEQQRVCSVCSATENRPVDALGHTYENGICTICGAETPLLAGKTLSVLGASMSTYTGISNNPDYNSTIGKNAVYYTSGKHGVYADDTWWMQACADMGLRLLVNNSWSGSSLLYERNGTVGAYVDRCVQLHDDTGGNAGEMPDIIAIQMGTNDFQYYKDTLGTADIDYAALITENADGTYSYATPVTSLEAAAIVLHKISVRYPNAEVYYLNISQRIDGTDELIRSFNAELKQVVEHFGAHIVDIYGSAITMENFSTYIGDGKVHPNCLGMDAYTEAFKRALLANTAYEVTTHRVSLDLNGVTADYGDDKIVVSGEAFSCTLTAENGKELFVSVTMGGEDITDTACENGRVSIESVTADVVITTEAKAHEPQNYRWEFDGTDLTCVSGSNSLTKDSGTTTNGVFSKTSYTLENEVVLMHDLPWIVEWKCEGTFLNTNGSSGARVFTSDNVNANYNARYIFKSNTNGIVAMGEKNTAGSHNYGIALADHGIDWTALHTYRLENRIAEDGSNMVYLIVDGEEIGPMNHYFIGTKDQNTTSNWLSGKDFVFPYMGTDTHGFTNAAIAYIAVKEGGCNHSYTVVVTAPTCTERGYTTHTCTICGESYVDDYTDPRPLNILMIGNSFSWDAADFWYDTQTSMTYDAMKSILAPHYDVHLAVMYKGSATLAYHATCAMNNTAAYTYTEIGPQTNYQWIPSSGTNATNNILDQLEAREWDIIVIQSYQHEADGTEPRSTYTGGDARFAEPEASVGYLLDYFAEHESNADVYYYMPWATTKFYGNDTETGYQAIAKYTETTVPNLTGTNSGKSFAGIIPVGTGIQNARTTYFDALQFSSGSGSTALLKDPQNGLQYDSQHLSFGLGRYIAGIIVAEILIPQEMRKDSYAFSTVKDSPAVGELPQEYSVIAQLSAKYALTNPFQLTTLSDYETELADRVCDAIKTADYSATGIADEADLKPYVESVVADKLKNMGAADYSVTIHSFALKNGQIADMEATVTLRVGYTNRLVEIMVTNGMAHSFGEWEVISVPSAAEPGLNRRVCEICGFVEEVVVDGSWQKFALAEHLQKLPDDFCSETNLWDLLVPEKLMINHLGEWVSAGSKVYSVTIPVKPGEKIYANSFDQTDGRKGIQVSFIGDYGIVKTTFSSGTYNEFHANGGYLIAPEGTIAVNIPVWNVDADNNTIYFLDYDHIYIPAVTAPTCTEQGFTTYTCICGNSYVDDYVDALGHNWEDGSCTICGEADPDYHIPGDINGDGEVDNKDVTRLFRYLSSYDVEVVEAALDITGDGNVDNKDLTRLFRYLSGYDEEIH